MSGFTSGITSGGSFYITEYPTLNMKKAKTDDGWCITQYKDTDCILSYSSSKEIVCVMGLNIPSVYRTVTDEQDGIYKQNQKAAAEEVINLMEKED